MAKLIEKTKKNKIEFCPHCGGKLIDKDIGLGVKEKQCEKEHCKFNDNFSYPPGNSVWGGG
ncbi:hypothetical protein KAR28_00040 [Candidatus Parcubacteria bacterium]|nr:hypothetical protein [Candidatus Parcubacteria bacterium]